MERYHTLKKTWKEHLQFINLSASRQWEMGGAGRRLLFYTTGIAESITSLNCVCYMTDARVFYAIFKVLLLLLLLILLE